MIGQGRERGRGRGTRTNQKGEQLKRVEGERIQ